MEKIIVAVDTGNALIKTVDHCFVAGLNKHGGQKPFIQKEVLEYQGNYYTLSNERVAYKKDKTISDDYYILTLYAIAKELSANNSVVNETSLIQNQSKGDNENSVKSTITANVVLAMGLPLTDLTEYQESYSEYFYKNGDVVSFTYNNQPFEIRVTDVRVYPQGYSAALVELKELSQEETVYIIDIGGFTTDVVRLDRGNINVRYCESFDLGMIKMYSQIKKKLRSKGVQNIDEGMIYTWLTSTEKNSYNKEEKQLAKQVAQDYIVNIIEKMAENDMNLQKAVTVFTGGGSSFAKGLLEKQPERCQKLGVGRYQFIHPITRSNAQGYYKMASIEFKNQIK